MNQQPEPIHEEWREEAAPDGPLGEAQTPPVQDKHVMRRMLLYSFVVIPFLIALAGVFFHAALVAVTTESVDIYDLIDDVRTGHARGRWQSAYQLAAALQNPDVIPQDERFTSAMALAFEDAARERNPAVRQYMALALGQAGHEAFLDPLAAALMDDPPENRPYLIRALGLLQNDAAVPAIAPYVQDDEAAIRLEAVIALGNSGNPEARSALVSALDDPEPNVRWDAGVALAKLRDPAGADVLLDLLDRSYLDRFEQLDDTERERIMITAIRAANMLDVPELTAAVEDLAQTDPVMAVRSAALATLKG